MESNTPTAEVNKNSESSAAVETSQMKVEIEDCSDDSDPNGVTAAVKLRARNTTPKEEVETKEESIVEIVELDSDEDEDATVSDVVEMHKKPKSAAAVEKSKEQSSISSSIQNDNSVGINLTKIASTPTTTTPTVPDQKSVASVEVVQRQRENANNEDEIKEEEEEEDEEEVEIKSKHVDEGVQQVATEAKKELVTIAGNDTTEKKCTSKEHAAPALKTDLSATQPQMTELPIDVTQVKQHPPQHVQGENWKLDNIKDIISNIDSNIEKENIPILKQKQKELLEKQLELAQQIHQQQLIAQQLAAENRIHQQQLAKQKDQQQHIQQHRQQTQQEETQKYQVPPIHQSILAPYQPQENNSKYLTVEETQNEHGFIRKTETYESKESSNATKHIDLHKIFTPAIDAEEILPRNRKLYASSAFYSPALHPTVEDQVELARRISHSLSDISNQKSKGQSMYVNRKKRSVKWVHEGAGQDYHQQPMKQSTSPSILPAYSDAGKHRVQLNLHQEQVLEKYVKPGLKVVKTPWEAALETGSASSAFVEDAKLTPYHAPTPTVSPAPVPQYQYAGSIVADHARFPTSKSKFSSNPQRDLAYKPSLPQGWKSPSVTLPKELYLPKEISLESYAPPPLVNIKEPENYKPSWRLPTTSSPAPNCFPLGKPSTAGFLNYGSTSPKQQYYEPTLYKPAQQETTPNMPQISYNPLPLPYDKIAKFENATEPQTQNTDWNPQHRRLAVQSQGSKARNASPAPFGEKPTSIERLSSPSPYSHNATKNEVYERTTAPIYTRRHNINELLHGQNYNNIARGWLPRRSGTGIYPTACGVYNTELGAKGYGGIQQIPLAAAKDLPYTDF